MYSETDNTTILASNSASINNNIKVNSDTGNNTASNNTGAGVIQTGNATAGLNIVNMANTNVVAKKFIAILVNVLGSWLGDVVTPDQQAPASTQATVLPTLPVLPTIPPVQQVSDPYIPPVGGTPTNEDTYVASFNSYEPQTTINYIYVYPEEYTQAVDQVNTAKQKLRLQKQAVITPLPAQTEVVQEGRIYTRGLFLSAAFIKATESTFPGILLGGVSL